MNKNNYKAPTEFIVEDNIGLLEFLFLNLKDKSKNSVKSLLQHGSICVDGNVETQFDLELISGQNVVIKQSQIYNKKGKGTLDIIYEDNEIIVINKPEGLLSISSSKEREKTAYKMVMDYVKRVNPKNRIFIVHRLDRDTSGVLLLAKNERLKHTLQDKWDELVKIRGYVAVVEGNVEKPKGTITSYLKETESLLVYSTYKSNEGKLAITHYEKVKQNSKYTLLNIVIDTGRKNQIRVHMKDLGHSVIGDKKYGSVLDPIKRLGLHANVLELIHPVTKKILHFEAPIPGTFLSIFKR